MTSPHTCIDMQDERPRTVLGAVFSVDIRSMLENFSARAAESGCDTIFGPNHYNRVVDNRRVLLSARAGATTSVDLLNKCR